MEMPANAIVIADQVFVALRKAGRPSAGWSPAYHAVTPCYRVALCSAEPGPGSSWAEPPNGMVTCPNCLKRMAVLAAREIAKNSVNATACSSRPHRA
jgi:hypothetical protein